MSVAANSQAAAGTAFRVFVSTAPGLERALETETLRLLGDVGRMESKEAGVELYANEAQLWRLVHFSRCASAVRARLCKPFQAQNLKQLSRRLEEERLPWRAWLDGSHMPSMSVTSRKSVLFHTKAIEEVLQRHLHERLGAAIPSEIKTIETKGKSFPETLHVRLSKNMVGLSLNLGRSDQEHWQRGYRRHVVEGSLRENLAASLLELTGVASSSPPACLWNPFCGSGVLACEAALLCNPQFSAAVRFESPLALQQYRNHSPQRYQAWLQANASGVLQDQTVRLVCSDVDRHAVHTSQRNAAALDATIECLQGDTPRVVNKIPHGATVVANPPYGKQCQGRPADVVDKFCATLKHLGRDDLLCSAFFLIPRGTLLRHSHRVVASFNNGGVAVDFVKLQDQPPT